MKVRDAIELASILIGDDELVDSGIFGYPDCTEAGRLEIYENYKDDRILNILMRCLRTVIDELCLEGYIHTVKIIECKVSEGYIPYSELKCGVVSILNVKDLDNNTYIDFSECVEGIRLSNKDVSNVEIHCDTLISDFNFNDELEIECPIHLLSYGIVSEYCLIKNDLPLALRWERLYKLAIQNTFPLAKYKLRRKRYANM